MIWAVRDPIEQRVPIKEKGSIVRFENQITDEGVSDKRLLVTETEFASVLQRMSRESNTLSAVMRQGWDTGKLGVLTKNQTARATDAHISVVAHITKDELGRLLGSTEAANGFANRILWCCAKRSKYLPFGGQLGQVDISNLTHRLKAAIEFARRTGHVGFSDTARQDWEFVYRNGLSEERPGLFGAVTARSETHTLKLATLYALLDCSAIIQPKHLEAALAVWGYCESSARFIFGDAIGDATADEILAALRARPNGMARTEIRDYFQRNKSSGEIARALGVLAEQGKARMELSSDGPGRPAEIWRAL